MDDLVGWMIDDISLTVTFVRSEPTPLVAHTVPAVGFVVIAGQERQAFRGWIELMTILEDAALVVAPVEAM